MTKNEKIKKLFNDNNDIILKKDFVNTLDKDKNPINETLIVYDGIVDEDLFKGTFLFLLKEAVQNQIKTNNQFEIVDNTFDLVSHAKKEGNEQRTKSEGLHWKELCEWIYAYYYPDHSWTDVKEHGKYLSEIAIMNIKKVAGLSTTDTDVLNRIVRDEQYCNILKAEIEYIAPKIVICCGTYEQAKQLYKIEDTNITLKSGVQYFKSNDRIFVDFIHPTQYGAAQKYTMKYAFAKEVFGELQKRQTEL